MEGFGVGFALGLLLDSLARSAPLGAACSVWSGSWWSRRHPRVFPAASDVYTTEAGSAAVGPDPSEPGTRPPDRNAPGALAMLDAVSWRTAVELDGVTFRYDAERHPALHDVSLVVPQRGVTAVAHSDGPGPVPV